MKKIDKILKAALICPAILSVVSCKEPEQDLFYLEKQIEKKIEMDVLEEIKSDSMGVTTDQFHLFNLKYINISNQENIYFGEWGKTLLILNGDIIENQHIGRQAGNITYYISKESYVLAKSIKESNSQAEKDGYLNDDFAYQKYGDSLTILKQILEDSETMLLSVYNNENKEYLYYRPSMLASSSQDERQE